MRHISDSDWDAIVALEADAYTDDGLSEGRAALQSRAHASPATCFVVEHGNRTAGYLLALPYPMFEYPDLNRAEDIVFHSRNLHLHDLVIAEELRGRGLAKGLLRHFTGTAGSKGYEAISLVAVSGSDTFWAVNGYRAHRDVTPPKSYGADAVYMSRAVPGVRGSRTNPAHASSHRAPLEDEVG
ncbi:GNAT family N-acetyltransferase [Streptomyces sp. NBC_01363]|uniref:GNAT family N-acetyltransferase n=1 Tax=Streptomyces sp. NBC_01363 TaxID=2903840 RepID=UPI00224EB819|nr:GNAT family N-acetyltransferase [Streptomyces sp. NBC_01363]MCX4735409.1 GNAT family N-acetyltransferase [Streptomyces sp. NBC_01363]